MPDEKERGQVEARAPWRDVWIDVVGVAGAALIAAGAGGFDWRAGAIVGGVLLLAYAVKSSGR